MATFVIDGQEHKLTITGKNGIDYSQDFIGNTSHGMKRDEDGRFIATREDLEWWQKTMAEHEQMEELVTQYEQKYGYDTVQKTLGQDHALDTDLDMMPKSVRRSLETLD